MKTKFLRYALIAMAVLSLYSCKKEYCFKDRPDGIKVYVKKELQPYSTATLNFISNGRELLHVDQPLVNVSLPIKLTRPVDFNWLVNFSYADSSLLKEFNAKNNTTAVLFPKDAYIPTKSIYIKKNTTVDSLKFDIRLNKIPPVYGTYILPVQINSSIENTTSSNFGAFYFVVNVKLTEIAADQIPGGAVLANKSDWKVVYVDSEEKSGEGPNNGRAKFALDNNPDTYWHTQWQGGMPGMPHTIVVDMAKDLKIRGISYINRKRWVDGRPADILISTSLDNKTWSKPINYFTNDGEERKYLLFPSPVEARYFKFTVQRGIGNKNFCYLAEVDAILAN